MEPVADAETLAAAVAVSDPVVGGRRVFETVRESGGLAVGVSEGGDPRRRATLTEREGLAIEPAGALGLAAVLKVAADGNPSDGGVQVVSLTGHALNDQHRASLWSTHPTRSPPITRLSALSCGRRCDEDHRPDRRHAAWESSAEYYRLINEAVKRELGGLHSAQLLMYSVDFAEVEEMQRAGEWAEAGQAPADAARRLERGGADFLVLCTSTMHKVAADIKQAVDLPLLHIVDPTGEALRAAGISRVGLLGTRFTMVEDFYRQRVEQKFGLEVLIPEEADRESVHRVIYDESVPGRYPGRLAPGLPHDYGPAGGTGERRGSS